MTWKDCKRLVAILALIAALSGSAAVPAYGTEEALLRRLVNRDQQAVPITPYLERLQQIVPPPPDAGSDRYARLRRDPRQFEHCTQLAIAAMPGGDFEDPEAIEEYLRSCLAEPDAPGLAGLRPSLDAVTAVIATPRVVWRPDDRRISCSAVRVLANLFATALHCLTKFVDPRSGRIDSTAVARDVRVYLAASPANALRVHAVQESSYYAAPGERVSEEPLHPYDYAFLRTDNPDVPMPSMVVERTAVPEIIVLFSVSRLTLAVENPASSPERIREQTDRGGWIRALRWDDSPACAVAQVASGCLLHGCQTEQVSSGAGIFRYSEKGTLTLVGIHTGNARHLAPASAAHQCERPSGAFLDGNAGIDVAASMLDDLQEIR